MGFSDVAMLASRYSVSFTTRFPRIGTHMISQRRNDIPSNLIVLILQGKLGRGLIVTSSWPNWSCLRTTLRFWKGPYQRNKVSTVFLVSATQWIVCALALHADIFVHKLMTCLLVGNMHIPNLNLLQIFFCGHHI